MDGESPSTAIESGGSTGLDEALSGLLVEPTDGSGLISDFGGVVQASPAGVAAATTIEDARRVFAYAGENAVPVVMRGTGHSCGGQSLVQRGLLLENRLEGEIDWADDEEVEVPTGLPWRTVEVELNARGRAVPVLPSVLDISVGGILAVGGYGTNSPARGPLIDHVTALELLSPDGKVRWCSSGENEELFRFALAGSGQLGLITRARLRTYEHRPDVDLRGYRFESLSAMADALRWMDDPAVSPPPYMRAFSYKPDRPGIVLYGELTAAGADGPGGADPFAGARQALGEPATAMATENVRMMEDEFDRNWVERYPDHHRLWIDYGFSYESFVRYCGEVERLARDGAFGKAIRAVYVSVVPESGGGDDYFPFDIRPAGVERTFTCGLYCMVPHGDAATLEMVRRALRRCNELMSELGGRPYVYGFNEMGPTHWRRAFGDPAIDRMLALKGDSDPAGVIPPPWDRIEPERLPDGDSAWTPKFRADGAVSDA